jgi:hypothetical protein
MALTRRRNFHNALWPVRYLKKEEQKKKKKLSRDDETVDGETQS